MNMTPLPLVCKTKPRTAKTIASNVDTTAANCGLFPNGAAMKKDQLPRTRPRRRCRPKMRPPLEAVKTRPLKIKETMIQAGRYDNEMATCHDLQKILDREYGNRSKEQLHDPCRI